MKNRFTSLLTILTILVCITELMADKPIEGFGAVTKGGQDGEIYNVTNLNNSGPGSLRDAVSQGNRYVVFDTAGTIVLDSEIRIKVQNLTIDGSTAPAPGITIKKSELYMLCLGIAGGAQDIIIQYLRVQGMWEKGKESLGNNIGTVYIAGSNIRRIVLDHITTRNAYDSGLDIWGDIRDVTIQYCMIAYNYHPQTISHYPPPFRERKNISIHHCIYAHNLERNPQMRALTRNIDYVNNIIYDWFWYGIRIKNKWQPDEPKVTANLINNAFIPGEGRKEWALVFGESPGADEKDEGPDSVLPQGTVYTESDMDSLYVSGNLLPDENMDHYSTISQPLLIPEFAKVTTYEVSALADSVIPFVGTHYPLADEVSVFNTIQNLLNGIDPTEVKRSDEVMKQGFILHQNYPNPFNPTTKINYEIPIMNYVELNIYNLLGEKVETLVSGVQEAGRHQVTWDASEFTSGVYIYRLTTNGGFSDTKKLLLLK